jgi:DMSO/TMAO reductase YedYZ molybdopterin-dependent catalytic subunit
MALGAAEFIQGLSDMVPSLPVAISQRIIEFTPGNVATAGIAIFGKAATPILVTVVVVAILALGGLLALLSRRSRVAALVGALAVGATGLAAAFSEPIVGPVQAELTVLIALVTGIFTYRALSRTAESVVDPTPLPEVAGSEQGTDPAPEPFAGRYREAHSREGIVVGRGAFLLLATTTAVAGLAAAGTGRFLSSRREADAAFKPVRLSGPPGGASGISTRTTLSPPPADASIDVPGMPSLLTPNEDFYLVDTAISSPRINVDRWSLKVKGAVENPIELTYGELLSLPTREADITMACVSNEIGGTLVSNARWTGVLLSDVLKESGVVPDNIVRATEQLVGRSVDGWEAGFRTEVALDGREALLAFGMNGEELPVKHGYPVRLVVPGLYGYVSATKWLTEIELTNRAYDVYWVKRGWSKIGRVQTQSRIDTVKDGDRLQAGIVRVGGVAWAPNRGIERVEVSTDNGETWTNAQLATQLDVDAWRQWIYNWEARPGEYIIKSRATDGDGETQTEREAAPIPSGATGYHTLRVAVA